MIEFTWEVQAQHAELALAAYAGWFDPDDPERVGPAPERGYMPGVITDRYDVDLMRSEHGEAVFAFRDRTTNEFFVVGRGTDAILDDGMQYIPGISDGAGTELGRLMAEVALEIFDATGQQVTVIGHSYAGHAAEEAARLAAVAILSATNFQGPGIVDTYGDTPFSIRAIPQVAVQGPFGVLDWLAGLNDFTPLGELGASVPVNRVVAESYDPGWLGWVQRVLDGVGANYSNANIVYIPVGIHSMAAVNAYYNGLEHGLLFNVKPTGRFDGGFGEIEAGWIEILSQGSEVEQAWAEYWKIERAEMRTKELGNEPVREKGFNNETNPPVKPIILDLDGLGLSVTELSQSTTFVDGGDGGHVRQGGVNSRMA